MQSVYRLFNTVVSLLWDIEVERRIRRVFWCKVTRDCCRLQVADYGEKSGEVVVFVGDLCCWICDDRVVLFINKYL